VNDTTNVDALPDVVYSSDGTTNVVTASTDGVATGVPSEVNTNITVTVPATPGWGYFEIIDPGAGVYPIASVTRSDGVQLLVGPNVWQTPARLHMVPPKPNNLIHIFDCNSTGTYTVTYGLPVLPPTVTTLDALNVTPTNATFNAIVNPNGASTEVYFQWGPTTSYGQVTATTTLTQSLNDTQAVAIAAAGLPYSSTIHYRAVGINSAGTTYGADLTLGTPTPLPVAGVYTISRTPGTKLHILWSSVSNVWSDPDGDALSVAWINLVSTNGITVLTNSQQILYPNAANVNDQLQYAITDGFGGFSTNVINIVINPFAAISTGQSSEASVSGGKATVSFYGIIGLTYEVQRSTNLVNWVTISINTVGPGGKITVTDRFTDLGAPPPAAYYRLAWQP